MKRVLIRCILIIGFTYVAILGFLIACETTLVYPGSRFPRGNWEPDFSHEDLYFPSADGTELNAWLLPADAGDATEPAQDGDPCFVLLCHGNGENVAQSSGYIGRNVQQTLNANVLVFDYHGFGKVGGVPNEQAVKEDAEAALGFLCERFSIQPSDVIVVGHSIGGGPAIHLAATKGCRGLVVQRTFSSLPDVAQSMYWWLPVRYLMSNEFNSAETIKNYDGPFLQSHGELDRLIPIEFGRKLFESCPSTTKEFFAVPQMGHLDPLPKEYWVKLDEWKKGLD
jgi:fermentation-respiration switch protein FrsA (DUF1100 family)